MEGRLFGSSQKLFEVYAHALWKETLSAAGLEYDSDKARDVKDENRVREEKHSA